MTFRGQVGILSPPTESSGCQVALHDLTFVSLIWVMGWISVVGSSKWDGPK
jgi:hypothetical protein